MKLQFVSYDNIDIIKSNLKSWVDNFKQDSSDWLCHVCNLYRFCKTRRGRCLSFGTFTAHRPRETETISLRLSASNLRIFSGDGRCSGVCVSQCFALSAIHRSVPRSCYSSQGEVAHR